MKKIILTIGLLIFSSSISFAAICGCDAPPECGSKLSCNYDSLENMYGRQFCEENKPNQGLIVSPTGETIYFNHFAGMPDPSVYFKISRSTPGSNRFKINSYQVGTNELLKEGTTSFIYSHRFDFISEENNKDMTMSEGNCR